MLFPKVRDQSEFEKMNNSSPKLENKTSQNRLVHFLSLVCCPTALDLPLGIKDKKLDRIPTSGTASYFKREMLILRNVDWRIE